MTHDLIPFRPSQVEPQLADGLRLTAGQLTASTIKKYGQHVRAYEAFCRERGRSPFVPASLASWRDHLAIEKKESPHTIALKMAAVRRTILEMARPERGLIDHSISAAFAEVPGPGLLALKEHLNPHARIQIAPAEMRAVLNEPSHEDLLGMRNAALLAVLASSGARNSEARLLKQDDLMRHAGGCSLLVRGKKDVLPRQTVLSVEAYEKVEAWLAARRASGYDSDYIFTAYTSKRREPHRDEAGQLVPLSAKAVWKIVKQAVKAVGFDETQMRRLQYAKPHDFRRFVGTQLISTKGDIRLAQKVLGHRQIRTTASYDLGDLPLGVTDDLC